MKPPPIVKKPTAVFRQSGAMERGKGKITGVIALTLGGLAVLSVLAFHFPQYLTTPDLRKKYDVNVLREVLLVGMVIAGGMALANLIRLRNRWLNATALALIGLAVAMGGHRVAVGDFPDNTPYIGLDWFILDLLGSSMVFILIEKMFPLHRTQPVFRPGWQVDFTHFIVNHLLVGLALLIVNFAIHRLFGWLVYAPLQKWIGGLPFFAELFLVLLVADLVQYWTHRAYHEIPFLWRFHAVHHSAEYMDWMAGSRLHLFELLPALNICGSCNVCTGLNSLESLRLVKFGTLGNVFLVVRVSFRPQDGDVGIHDRGVALGQNATAARANCRTRLACTTLTATPALCSAPSRTRS